MSKKWVVAALACAVFSSPLLAASGDYAEGIYRDYAAATSAAVRFEVVGLRSGAMDELAGRTMMQLTGVPKYTLVVEEQALTLAAPQFAVSDLKELYLEDLVTSVDAFEAAGFPLSQGRYRQLQVTVGIGKDQRTHRAVEFCWRAQNHCVVYDPSIDFLDSVVNNQRATKASGWAPLVTQEPVASILPANSSVKVRRCGLADFPNSTAASITWGARTVTYKSLVGLTVVTKRIGGAQAGVRCDASCRPQPYGYTNASSASAIYPNSVQCDFAHAQGTSGSSAKYVGKSGCAHRFVLGAKFNATAKGVGLGVDVTVDWTGGIDQNGGAYVTSCAYFN